MLSAVHAFRSPIRNLGQAMHSPGLHFEASRTIRELLRQVADARLFDDAGDRDKRTHQRGHSLAADLGRQAMARR